MALLKLFVESDLWQLLWPEGRPLAMHGILSAGGRTRCAFSLLSFITGIPKGMVDMPPFGPIQGLEWMHSRMQQLQPPQRMGANQAQLNIQSMAADPANSQLQHTIDIKVITDGEHHVLIA